jgi:hypothetical protein
MDRNFYTDDFERMLREMSDEFKMYPSKRIWNSIYNNIHPGRKWPSVVMTISLISTLLLVGHLNTTDATMYTAAVSKPLSSASAINPISTNPIGFSAQLGELTKANQPSIVVNNSNDAALTNYDGSNNLKKQKDLLIAKYASAVTSQSTSGFENKITSKNKSFSHRKSVLIASNRQLTTASLPSNSIIDNPTEINTDEAGIEMDEAQSISLVVSEKTRISNLLHTLSSDELGAKDLNMEMADALQKGLSSMEKKQLGQNKQENVSLKDKEWIENYALYNRPAPKKWAGKLSRQSYITPSIVYRSLTSGPNFGNTISNPPYAIAAENQALQDAIHQTPALGLEIGTGLQYSILKGLTIKGSVQLNYTRYNTNAFENSHPFSTQITLHNFATNSNYEIYKTTPYSNKSGLEAVKLHNETFQLSIPIGADLKLMGNEKLQWNIGATIQPTFIAGGNNYLISSDKRNFVTDPSLLNKWNLNAGLETFITYKSNGLTWQVGPQFRTQLFSTNSKRFVVEERLVNYGIKLGVSKIIR